MPNPKYWLISDEVMQKVFMLVYHVPESKVKEYAKPVDWVGESIVVNVENVTVIPVPFDMRKEGKKVMVTVTEIKD